MFAPRVLHFSAFHCIQSVSCSYVVNKFSSSTREQNSSQQRINGCMTNLKRQGCQRLFLLGPNMRRQNSLWRCSCAEIHAGDTSPPHAQLVAVISRKASVNTHIPSTVAITSYYCLCLDAQQLAPVIVSCLRHCLALQKPPLAPRNSYWRCFRRHSARLTPLKRSVR